MALRNLWMYGLGLASSLIVSSSAMAAEVRYAPADGHAQNPVWSADGKWLAFEVNRLEGSGVDLYVASVAGAIAKDGMRVSLPGTGGNFGAVASALKNPSFHPQGPVLFEGSNPAGKYRIYLYTPGGASATELINSEKIAGNLTFPSVSKDGNTVVFVSDSTGKGDVYTWTRSTGATTQMTSTGDSESFPILSADGKSIVYCRDNGGTLDIYSLDIASKTEKALVTGGGDQCRPIFAGNGNILYFTGERGNDQWDIASVDAAGGNKVVLAKGVDLPEKARPSLSPDGMWLAWGTAEAQKTTNVFLAKVDNSAQVVIPTEHDGCREPAITVAGGRTVLAYSYLIKNDSDWRKMFVVDITDKL